MKTTLKTIRTNNLTEHPLSTHWIVVDWDGEFFKINKQFKPEKSGGCCAYTKENAPQGIDAYSVLIFSRNPMKMTSLGLKSSAWRTSGIGQCDAILFPSSDKKNDAILFIETKYSSKKHAWTNYKKHALRQIIDTVAQLRLNHCPVHERNLYGMISFPLINTVGATAFSPSDLMKIYRKHKLTIHIGNVATFINTQKICFTR